VILDTHYVFALASVDTKLRKRERAFLAACRERLLVSSVSIWEIRLKWNALLASGARKGPASPQKVLEALSSEPIEYLTLTPEHAAAQLAAAPPHRDPFDELLLAQAQVEKTQLLTRDGKLKGHPLARFV
jgi:PIN domain nuclease of toxin-antitoxin system